MKRGFFILLVSALFLGLAVSGQTVKTDVLVIGNGSHALGAGIQAAVSGVKTTILMQEQDFELAQPGENLHSGLEAEYLRKKSGKEAADQDILKSWTDSIKNLSLIKGVSWSKLKRAGSGWSLELNDGRKIRALVLVNAERSGSVNTALLLQQKAEQWRPFSYEDNSYRTSIGSGLMLNNTNANILTLSDLLVPEQENLVVLNPLKESLPGGQAAGATAAYAAFFKKKTSETNLKELQGELIRYKLALVPFADVSEPDSNWKAIQFTGLSGILKGTISNGMLNFNPEQPVTATEIREPIKAYYYKAQIWFDDHKGEEMTIGATLDLICYVKGRSLGNTTEEVKKKWNSANGFKDEFSPDRVISRREFAILLNDYLQPFNVTIDKTGRILR